MVHTTQIGDKFYANKIYDFFIYNNIITYEKIPLENKYFKISYIDVNKIVNNYIIIKGNFEIIGIYQKIGPNSGLINIIKNNNIPFEKNLWDKHCYYERYSMGISTEKNQIVIIKILQDIFDTSSCKNKDIKFDNYTKYMDIKKIYYIGDLYIDLIDDISQNIIKIKNNNISQNINKTKSNNINDDIIQNKSRKIKLFRRKNN
jgi:Fe-S cluster assembly iron-binding protein IscA